MIRTAFCPRCGQQFTFDTDEVPAQRAQLKGRRFSPVIAHYPVCTHCRERVEIADLTVTSKLTKRRFRRAR